MNGMVSERPTWVLTDAIVGHAQAATSVASMIGGQKIQKHIRYHSIRKRFSAIAGPKYLIGVDQPNSDPICRPWPKLIIACGSHLGRVARYIKHRAALDHEQVRLVQINDPAYGRRHFDLIVCPAHDQLCGANVLNLVGTPASFSQEELTTNAKEWAPKVSHLGQRFVALFVGGNFKRKRFSLDDAKTLGLYASKHAALVGAALLITTSRRTPADASKALLEAITVPHYAHKWSESAANPYRAFLSMSQSFIVTGDSISMCSEVCTVGKSLLIYDAPSISKHKFTVFHNQLYALGAAKPIELASIEDFGLVNTPLIVRDPMSFVADEIRRRGLLA